MSFGERIRIGDHDLTATEFAAAVTRAARAADLVNRALDADDHVTQFEALTAAAYSEMARQDVECAVIEAGLGGRYDATNVIPSTGPGADQRRPGAHALAGADARPTSPARSSTWCSRRGRWCWAAGWRPRWWRWPSASAAERGARIVRAGTDPGVPVVRAAGLYQRRNFALARTAAEMYYLGRALDPAAVAAAAAEVRVPGRLEQIDTDPLTVLDVAHNPEGMRALTESLPELVARALAGRGRRVGARRQGRCRHAHRADAGCAIGWC